MASSDDEPTPRSASLRQLLSEELFADTEQEVKALEDEIESLTRRAVEIKREMRQLWDEGGLERKSRYKLTAVFIHRGEFSPFRPHPLRHVRDSADACLRPVSQARR